MFKIDSVGKCDILLHYIYTGLESIKTTMVECNFKTVKQYDAANHRNTFGSCKGKSLVCNYYFVCLFLF